MEAQPYLIFKLKDSLYGIAATLVQEIFFLPELTTITEAPYDIAGFINLRGEILPVMDLNLRLGYQLQDYTLTDSVIIVEWQTVRIGMIVNQVYEVQIIDKQAVKTGIFYGRELGGDTTHRSPEKRMNSESIHHFIAGLAKVEANLIMLLNPETLIRSIEPRFNLSVPLPTPPEAANGDGSMAENIDLKNHPILLTEHRVFAPKATPQERFIFRERAQNLMQSSQSQDFTGLIPLAVVGISDEYFGINLEVVREFTDIRKVTPIPCTPQYILGNMNLRGEIVTLVNLSSILNMPMKSSNFSKAMIVQIEDMVVGITVNEIFDVMYLHPSEIKMVPTAAYSKHDEYLRGTADYREKMMSILDLQSILLQGDLVVEEEV